MEFSPKDIKMECKSQGVPVTGNKKVLALRLAFKNLPIDVESSLRSGYEISESSQNSWGGKRVKMGSSDNAKKRPVPEKAKKDSNKAAKKMKQNNNQ